MNENHWSPDCKFIKCAKEKGIETCPLCADYPCADITAFDNDGYVHHRTVLPNGRRIKAIGLEAWLDEQRERWRCKQCGRGYTWFEENCDSCGAKLFNVNAEFGAPAD